MKRKLSFIGSILGIIFSAVDVIIMAMATLLFVDGLLYGTSPALVIGLIITAILTLCAVAALVMNILVVKASKNAEKLRSKKVVVIVAAVLNLVSGAYLVYSLLTAFSILNFLNALGLIAASVLMIVDLVKLKKEPVAVVEAPAENSENV